jgi:2-C-methyl-D-erythritol 4-phosphate cytidylyltransferase
MGMALGGIKKEFLPLEQGKTVLRLSTEPFLALPGLQHLLVTLPRSGFAAHRRTAEADLAPLEKPSLTVTYIPGGETRQESVRLALEALGRPFGAGLVLIHDGARPFVSTAVIRRVLEAALEHGAAVPVVPPVDTIKAVDPDGRISGHLRRASLALVQTPQGFTFLPLLQAHQKAQSDGTPYTDDSEIWGRYEGDVWCVPGSVENRKITTPEDLR